jgi:hypothetical protein
MGRVSGWCRLQERVSVWQCRQVSQEVAEGVALTVRPGLLNELLQVTLQQCAAAKVFGVHKLVPDHGQRRGL